MAQHDYIIDDASGLIVRADLNAVLAAIVTNNSGPVEPLNTFGGMWWVDTSLPGPGVLKIRNQSDDAWVLLPTGAEFVSILGGNIEGDLHVAGIFSNPEYDRVRANHAGATEPASPVPGMTWYDTSVTPAVIRVRNPANNAWTATQATLNPVFTDSATISAAGNLAELDLIAAGEKRRVVSDAAGNRMTFYNPADVAAAWITDAGDLATLLMPGGLQAALAGKQPNLGVPAVVESRGAAFVINHVSGVGPQLLAGAEDWGMIYTSTFPLPPFLYYQIGLLGAWAFVASNGINYASNMIVSGSYLSYTYDGGGYIPGQPALPGTWRNMSFGATTAGVVAQRVL